MNSTGIKKARIAPDPNPNLVSTSYVERQNLIISMHMRRFTRLTNAFSNKIENHCYALALHFVYYNFAKTHKSLSVTPAMQSGPTKRVMTLEDIVNLVPVEAPKKEALTKRMKKITKTILWILTAVIVVLALTNPNPKSFREYIGVSNSWQVKRTGNWVIFSIYTTPNTYYKYYNDEKYLGIFLNFFRLQSDD